MSSKILVIAAHPDDEVLGCGGTIAGYAGKGDEVYCLILGEGATSRDSHPGEASRKSAVRQLKTQAGKAAPRKFLSDAPILLLI